MGLPLQPRAALRSVVAESLQKWAAELDVWLSRLDALLSKTTAKAWARVITDGAGAVAIEASHNIASVNVRTNIATFVFQKPLPSDNYIGFATRVRGVADATVLTMDTSSNAAQVLWRLTNATAGTAIDPATTAVRFTMVVL